MAEEAPANSKRKVRAGSPSRRKSSAKKRKVAVHERTPEVADAIFSETSYYIKNGLRHVFPYYFTFTSYAKGRWVGSTVYDVFCKEFQSEKPEYYEFAIKSGKVTVNNVWATMDTRIKDNDVIAHKIHRHEPPVTAGDMEVVFEDDNVIVVDKPSSIPVHPCGRYRHNTVLFILSKEQGLRNLRTAHRLDRLTSGVLIIAKNLSTAQKLEAEIRNRDIQKEYVCRVKGEFPEGDVDCNEPILIVSHKLGVSKVDPSGKPCSTQFHRLSFNGTSSVVRCLPKTGRIHQIRVHLQWLGYPIVNDPLYNARAWGPHCGARGKGTEDMEKVIKEITLSTFSSETGLSMNTEHATACEQSPKNSNPSEEPRAVKGNVTTDGKEVTDDEQEVKADEEEVKTDEQEVKADKEEVKADEEEVKADEEEVKADEEDVTMVEQESCVVSGVPSKDEMSPSLKNSESIAGSSTEAVGSPVGTVGCTMGTVQTSSETMQSHVATVELPVEGMGSSENTKGVGSHEDMVISCVDSVRSNTEIVDSVRSNTDVVESSVEEVGSSEEMEGYFDPDCTECQLSRPDPSPQDLVMYLHAMSYKGPTWEYRTRPPSWAEEGFREP